MTDVGVTETEAKGESWLDILGKEVSVVDVQAFAVVDLRMRSLGVGEVDLDKQVGIMFISKKLSSI